MYFFNPATVLAQQPSAHAVFAGDRAFLAGLRKLGKDELEPGDICMEYVGGHDELSTPRKRLPTRMGLKNLLLNRIAARRTAWGVPAPWVAQSRKVLHTCVVLGARRTEDLHWVGSMTSRGNGPRLFYSFDGPISLVFRLKNPAFRRLFLNVAREWSNMPRTIAFRFSNLSPFRSICFGVKAREQLSRIAESQSRITSRAPMHCSEFVCAAGAMAAALLRREQYGEALPTALAKLGSAELGVPGWAFLMHPKNIMTANLYQRLRQDPGDACLAGYVVVPPKPLRRI